MCRNYFALRCYFCTLCISFFFADCTHRFHNVSINIVYYLHWKIGIEGCKVLIILTFHLVGCGNSKIIVTTFAYRFYYPFCSFSYSWQFWSKPCSAIIITEVEQSVAFTIFIYSISVFCYSVEGTFH